MKLGFQPVNISAELYGNASYPAGFRLGPCAYIHVAVPEANQGAGEDVAGAKTETDEQEQPQKQ